MFADGMMTEKENLQELLEKLIQVISSAITDGLRNGTLQPQFGQYFRWKLTKFEERDDGTIEHSAQGEEFLKPDWFRVARDIYKKVREGDLFRDAVEVISREFGINETDSDDYLEQLTIKVAENILAGKTKTTTDSAKYVTSFLKDLNGESREYRAEVKLKGLILQPRSIQLDSNVKLRKPSRKDFEKEVPITFPSHGTWPLRDPTAFLHTSVYSDERAMHLQNEIDREIAVLRLFRVGAVQYLQYTADTESIILPGFGTLTSGRLSGSDDYLITKEDVKPLKTFWVNMKNVKLPASASASGQEEPDELSIAYDRYGDSLEAHILEKRISSAVMGLEALYLSPSERQELTFKLSMRVGKLLSQIGYSAEKVRKELTHAYDIRSTYVHGKTLTQKQKNRHEKEVGELGKFSKVVMDYLRASIVAWLERPSKTSLIQKIDDSFLDSKKEEEIKKLLFMPY